MSLDDPIDTPVAPPPTRCPSCGKRGIHVLGNPNAPTGFDIECDACGFDSELLRGGEEKK